MQNSKPFASNSFAAKPAGAGFAGPSGRATISARDRERLFFFMSMMMKTGQTTADSLRSVAKAFRSEGQDGIAGALVGIAQKVSQGRSLSQSMMSERQMFSDVHRAAVLAGEASNNMQKSFEVLRVLEDKAIASSRAGMAELLTPLLMLVLSLVSIFNTGLNTLPVMANLQQQQGKPVAMVPRGIISATHFCAQYWYLFVGVVVILGIMTFTLYGSPQGRGTLDKIKLRIPIYGKYLTLYTYNQMLLYFPYLIASGVKAKQLIPIMEALTTNSVLKRKIDAFNHVITTGGTMAEAMTRAGFPELIVTPVSVAENYAPTEGSVNDVLIEGMQHAHAILERILNDTHARFIAVFSSFLWVLGGAVMMMDMLSIVMCQA